MVTGYLGGFCNQVEPHAMALKLSITFDNSGAEGWQCDWLCCFDSSLAIRLCLYKLPSMSGTTHHLP